MFRMLILSGLTASALTTCAPNTVTENDAAPTAVTTSNEDAASNEEDRTQPGCSGAIESHGNQQLLKMADGSWATMAKLQVNLDGAGKAYHKDNYAGGAIIHLCNAGQVHLPDGSRYYGSESNSVCTGKFMDDYRRIRAAGWKDPSVGVIRWFGILGEDEVQIAGRTVRNVVPVEQSDGSGFYISPTALADASFPREDQRRYLDALSVPAAVVGRRSPVRMGSLGVAWRVKGCRSGRVCDPVPFIVGDIGPRIGEGSLALTRLVNGLSLNVEITRQNRYEGAVSTQDVIYVFFNGGVLDAPYTAARVEAAATRAFETWGGAQRLTKCHEDANAPKANE